MISKISLEPVAAFSYQHTQQRISLSYEWYKFRESARRTCTLSEFVTVLQRFLIKYAREQTAKIISISAENAKPFNSFSKKITVHYNPVQLTSPTIKHISYLKNSFSIMDGTV